MVATCSARYMEFQGCHCKELEGGNRLCRLYQYHVTPCLKLLEKSTVSVGLSHSCAILEQLSFAADEEFDELCFEFGIELDEVVSRGLRKGGG